MLLRWKPSINVTLTSIYLRRVRRSTNNTYKTYSKDGFQYKVFAGGLLTQLVEPTLQWSSILIQLLSSQLDVGTLEDWEEHVTGENKTTYNNLVKFLTMKVRSLDSLSINVGQNQASSHIKSNFVEQPKPAQTYHSFNLIAWLAMINIGCSNALFSTECI